MKFNRHFASWFGCLVLGICGLSTSLWADSVVVFNEIMYHPGQNQTSGEWIEMHNQMAVDVDISGWSIKDGVTYTFPEGTFLPGGGYLLIAESPAALETETGITGILGPFEGNLSNAGETLKLENNSGRLMDAMEYNDKGDWPIAPDGSGVTLAKKHKNKASVAAENWTWSSQIGGTPGAENFPTLDMRPVQRGLVGKNDTWRYNSQGGNLGQTWRQTDYSDSTWSVGQAGFYYGNTGGSGEPEKITTLFSSGLDNEGNPLSPGQYDPHYRFVSSGQQVIAMQNHPAWLANDATSQWIGFSGQGTDNQAPGQFYIATTFDLTGWDPGTALITLYLAADNRVDDVLINGLSTGITCLSYNQWYGPFVINSGFIEGLNTLQFVFTNEGADVNPAGLRIKLEGTAVADYGRTQLPACPMTTYFRKTFSYNKPDSATLSLQLEGLVDDGAVFYLNNVEIYRTNMPSGTIDYDDTADDNLTEPELIGPLTLPADALQDGLNTLAVEVHQAVGGQNDLFFLAELNVTETPIPPGEGLSLAFSEIPAYTAQPFWIEIVNTGSQQVNLAGTILSLNGDSSTQYVFPSQLLGSKGYAVVNETVLGFRPAEGDKLVLYAPQQTVVMDAAGVKDTPQARMVAVRGPWYTPQTLTSGQANDIQLHTDIIINEIMYHKGDTLAQPGEYQTSVLVPAGAEAFVIIPSDNSFGTTWTGGNEPFNDSTWTAGTGNTTGIGYDQDPDYLTDIGTNIEDDIFGERQSFYARIPFNWTSQTTVESMTLNIKYDDGFIAYLNGQKIAERNAPASPAYTSGAITSHESGGYETIDVSAYISSLKHGENILAIHGLNYGIKSSDLLILPELTIREQITAPIEADETTEEWIELINKGSQPVNLTGWQIKGDIDYSFTPNTILAAGQYLVVARDHVSLLSAFPSIAVVGDFQGRLPNGGGKVKLLDASGNITDEVIYYDDLPWPGTADGYNASLELRHPDADNTNAQSWCASDESAKSQWKTYSYRGIAQPSSMSEPDSQWRELVIGMLDAGQILLDNISVIEDPDGSKIQLIQNGTFETSPADSKWRLLGSHRHSEVILDPDNPQNHVLSLVSTGPTDHMHNHLETTLASGRSIVNGRTYEISFRAKWISGSNQLNTRLYFNRLAKTTLIEKPRLNGTPGAQNSCYQSNPGPVFSNLTHNPAVPQDFEPVIVSVEINDPQE
ncbi:MAG: lamin tail domain-containing protein, partial [Anaerohalosphaeraceae bacterium]